MKRNIVIDEAGHTIPIEVVESEGMHFIYVDGVLWVPTDNQTHAAVLFNMMADHLTEYMNYQYVEK